MIAAFLSLALLAQAAPAHDRGFWVAIAKNDYKVPAGTSAFDLLVEMNTLIGSSDPVLRDDVAYGAAARWIYRQRLLSAEQLRTVRDLWLANLRQGIGSTSDDSVFRRSFSALDLSIIAALENEAPFLSQAEYDEFLGRALEYLASERDTRGYDPVKGWMHSPAHTADLLKFLTRNPRLAKAAQERVLDALAAKCGAVGHVFTWAEDERLAQVVRSIVRRPDFDAAALDRWLMAFRARDKQLWSAAPAIDPPAFAAVQNMKLMLRAALVQLANDADLLPAGVAARARLQEALK